MGVKIGIDLSLRSAGITVVDSNNKLLKIYIHQPKKLNDECYEELLINNLIVFENIINEIINEYEVDQINLEGLSFNSVSSSSDVIGAQYWFLRCFIHKLEIPLKIFSPANWRKINGIKDPNIKLKEYKATLGSDFWKLLALSKLDKETHDMIIYFCEDHNLKSKSEFDIADAYHIGCCK